MTSNASAGSSSFLREQYDFMELVAPISESAAGDGAIMEAELIHGSPVYDSPDHRSRVYESQPTSPPSVLAFGAGTKRTSDEVFTELEESVPGHGSPRAVTPLEPSLTFRVKQPAKEMIELIREHLHLRAKGALLPIQYQKPERKARLRTTELKVHAGRLKPRFAERERQMRDNQKQSSSSESAGPSVERLASKIKKIRV